MNSGFYFKFAIDSIRKNRRTYLPYIFTWVFMAAVYYIIVSLSVNDGLSSIPGSMQIQQMLSFGVSVIAIFSVIFLFYTNSFLIRQRKREFGLYNVLGMEKRHIIRIIFSESLITSLLGILGGLLSGFIFNWGAYLLLLNMIDAPLDFRFDFSLEAIRSVWLLFSIIFLLVFINSAIQILRANTIELIHAQNAGEREPKSKILLSIFGLLCLGSGYIMALKIKNPIGAMMMFFVAVILVIIGTYCLFTSGSIVLLKLMRRNKRYYYKTRHFIPVSSMMYRMKRNAVSLANICILSTMVLVTVSTTVCLYLGIDNTVVARYPKEINIQTTVYASEYSKQFDTPCFDAINSVLKGTGIVPENDTVMHYAAMTVVRNGSVFSENRDLISELTASYTLFFVPLEDYNRNNGTNLTLKDGEVYVYSETEPYKHNTLCVFGLDYIVKDVLWQFQNLRVLSGNAYSNALIVILSDIEEFNHLNEQAQALSYGYIPVALYYGFDGAGQRAQEVSEQYKALIDQYMLSEASLPEYESYTSYAEIRQGQKNDFLLMYAGLFFIGIFLGILFAIGTVLIIYYKQITEGYQDKLRYEIMRKVGLDQKETARCIRSQVLLVFFLPLITAGVHTVFAFPMITRMLRMLAMTNIPGFAWTTLCCFFAFAAFYVAVYLLTSKIYYDIVSPNERSNRRSAA